MTAPVLYLTLAAACVGWTSLRWAARLSGDPLTAGLLALLLGLAQVVGALQFLGAVHLLQPGAVLGLHVLTAAITALRLRGITTFPRIPAPRGVVAVAVTIGVLLIGVTLVTVSFTRGPTQEFDTRHYHAVNAAHWLDRGETWTLPYAQPGDFTATQPGDAELVGVWMMLSNHTDDLAYLAALPSLLLIVVAAAAVTRRLGGEAVWGAASALVVIGAQACAETMFDSLSSDPLAVAGLIAAVALVLEGQSHPDERWRWPLLAGVGLGLAAGSRLALLPDALILAAWAATRIGRRSLALSPGLCLAAWWYIRNQAILGNPISPLRLVAGPIHWTGPSRQFHADYLSAIARTAQHGPITLAYVGLASLILWGPAFLLLVGVAPVLLRRSGRRTSLALLTAALYGAYLLTPSSGGEVTGSLKDIATSIRYAMPALVVAGSLFPAVVGARLRGGGLTIAATYDVVRFVQGFPDRPDLNVSLSLVAEVALGLILCALLVTTARKLHAPRLSAWRAAAVVGLLAAVWSVGLTTQPAPSDPVDAAMLQWPGRQPVVAMVTVEDVRAVLGHHLDVPIIGVGTGQQGAVEPYATAAELNTAVQNLRPAVVAVGSFPDDWPWPQGWTPPSSWVAVGQTSYATTLYRP